LAVVRPAAGADRLGVLPGHDHAQQVLALNAPEGRNTRMTDVRERPGDSSEADAAARLEEQWRRGLRPDVDAFTAAAGPLPPDGVTQLLRVDQRRRWQAGERVPAEEYLRRHPAVAADPEAAVDLI